MASRSHSQVDVVVEVVVDVVADVVVDVVVDIVVVDVIVVDVVVVDVVVVDVVVVDVVVVEQEVVVDLSRRRRRESWTTDVVVETREGGGCRKIGKVKVMDLLRPIGNYLVTYTITTPLQPLQLYNYILARIQN